MLTQNECYLIWKIMHGSIPTGTFELTWANNVRHFSNVVYSVKADPINCNYIL